VISSRKFQLWRYFLNASAGHNWPAGRYLPTPALSQMRKISIHLIIYRWGVVPVIRNDTPCMAHSFDRMRQRGFLQYWRNTRRLHEAKLQDVCTLVPSADFYAKSCKYFLFSMSIFCEELRVFFLMFCKLMNATCRFCEEFCKLMPRAVFLRSYGYFLMLY